jgi:hypothetical protein
MFNTIDQVLDAYRQTVPNKIEFRRRKRMLMVVTSLPGQLLDMYLLDEIDQENFLVACSTHFAKQTASNPRWLLGLSTWLRVTVWLMLQPYRVYGDKGDSPGEALLREYFPPPEGEQP